MGLPWQLKLPDNLLTIFVVAPEEYVSTCQCSHNRPSVFLLLLPSSFPYPLFPILQVLLDLARGLFEETSSLEAMMTKVMKEAQHLIPCEHCTIIVLDQENQEVG